MNVSDLKSKLAGITAALLLASGAAHAQLVAQSPLSAGGNVPGNLLLVPSVEYPTILSIANLNAYSPTSTYTGYFDSFKCYLYSYDAADDTQSHFYPTSLAPTKICSGASKQWSGNFLNWAATQTIDPFRKALTGGLRTKDTVTETILEKARYHDANGDLYPTRRMPATGDNGALVQGAMATGTWTQARFRIGHLGNRMFFSSNNVTGMGETDTVPASTPYNSQDLVAGNVNTIYSVRVRVKVCVSAALLESNCVGYGANYKPEGLLQKYASRMRYSAFSYLNDSGSTRDGGVLRARQKFIGPLLLNPANGAWEANSGAEWDTSTGVLIANPDSADATATNSVITAGSGGAAPALAASGVINYVNKFGQMTTRPHKTFDPVSELYYTSIRYLRGMSNVPAYSDLTGTKQDRYNLADGFPVITTWDDPIQYYCQNNSILGIGDVYTHKDKNLRGYTGTASNEPGTRPAEVNADTVDVQVWSNRVAALEALSGTPVFPTTMPVNNFSGRENSAFIAGLAYYAHTQDLRTTGANSTDFQTASTYWVDVRETQNLEPRRSNMYYLATKYGGFTRPDTNNDRKFSTADFDSTTHATALPNAWWASTDPAVMTNGKQGFTNESMTFPNNYYTANQADKMVQSLTQVFAKIANTGSGSGSALAANSTRLDTETLVFQAQFLNGIWMGQVTAFDVDANGAVNSTTPLWRAATAMPAPAARNIHVHTPGGASAMQPFTGANLTATQATAWTFTGIGATTTAQDLVDYFRGVQTKEESATNGTGVFRPRVPPAGFSASLGDIVNSTPIFVGKPNPNLYSGATFPGANQYGTFVTAQASRTPAVWVGSNDGMLHAFNANTGVELFAFVPNTAIINGLAQYANPDYVHKFFVDGDMAIADAWDGSNWRTILVGTMGRGGPGIFALDVTNPASPTFLWERNGTNIPELGKNIGRPVIAQVASGAWRVILGNGYDHGDSPQLIMINLFTGAATTIDTGGSSSNNGLSAVLARDTNADGFADTAYAGDLRGNLWKFSSIGGTATVANLFHAEDGLGADQPITAAPLVGRDSSTGTVWVFFGTGKYLSTTDVDTTQEQTWYGIKDNGVFNSERDDLVERTITGLANPIGEFATRTVSAGTAAEVAGEQGWFMDLPISGERIVVPNRFLGDALISTTRIPDAVNACRPTGRGFVMAIQPFTGGRLPQTFFDANRDGVIDAGDTDGGQSPSGIGVNSGLNETIAIGSVLELNTDEGETKNVLTQGSSADAARMSWREVVN